MCGNGFQFSGPVCWEVLLSLLHRSGLWTQRPSTMAALKAGALAGLLVAVADGQLAENGVGEAHEKCDNDLKSICAGRTHRGNKPSVLIDVPKACAGKRSTCPVAFFFHGIGSNEKHTGRAYRPAPPHRSRCSRRARCSRRSARPRRALPETDCASHDAAQACSWRARTRPARSCTATTSSASTRRATPAGTRCGRPPPAPPNRPRGAPAALRTGR